jgi:hypothetical protein
MDSIYTINTRHTATCTHLDQSSANKHKHKYVYVYLTAYVYVIRATARVQPYVHACLSDCLIVSRHRLCRRYAICLLAFIMKRRACAVAMLYVVWSGHKGACIGCHVMMRVCVCCSCAACLMALRLDDSSMLVTDEHSGTRMYMTCCCLEYCV